MTLALRQHLAKREPKEQPKAVEPAEPAAIAEANVAMAETPGPVHHQASLVAVPELEGPGTPGRWPMQVSLRRSYGSLQEVATSLRQGLREWR